MYGMRMLFLILYIFLDFCPLYILFTYVENNVHFHVFLKRKKIRENAVKLVCILFNLYLGSSAILKRDQTGNIDGKQDTAPQQNQTTKYKQSSQQSKLISVDKPKQTADGHARPRKLSPIKNVQMNKYKTSLTWFAKRM